MGARVRQFRRRRRSGKCPKYVRALALGYVRERVGGGESAKYLNGTGQSFVSMPRDSRKTGSPRRDGLDRLLIAPADERLSSEMKEPS